MLLNNAMLDKNFDEWEFFCWQICLTRISLGWRSEKQLRNQTFFIEGDLCPTEHWLVEFVRLGLYRELKPESPAINYWLDDLHADLDLHA